MSFLLTSGFRLLHKEIDPIYVPRFALDGDDNTDVFPKEFTMETPYDTPEGSYLDQAEDDDVFRGFSFEDEEELDSLDATV